LKRNERARQRRNLRKREAAALLAPAANGGVKLFQTSNVTIIQNKHCCSPYLKTGSTHASNYLKTGSTHASKDGDFALIDLPDTEQLDSTGRLTTAP
jgi:hypothetical protein